MNRQYRSFILMLFVSFINMSALTILSGAPPISDTLYASIKDKDIRSDGFEGWDGSISVRVGGAGNGFDAAMVYPFQLPALENGKQVISADFSVQMKKAPSSGGNVDIYGLPYRSTDLAVSATDFYQGAFNSDPNAASIQDDFAIVNMPEETLISTNDNGKSLLATYINEQYAAGAKAGDYIFIRLNPDEEDVPNYKFWEFYTANSTSVPFLAIQIGEPIDPESVEIEPASVKIFANASKQLTKKVLPDNATNISVEWASSDTSIAVVDANGLVTAISEGSCTISVTTKVGGFSSDCSVTVEPAPLQVAGSYYCDPVNGSMSNDGSESSPWGSLSDVIQAGKSFIEDDIIYLKDGEHGKIVIKSSNPGMVTITKYPGHNPEISRVEFNGAKNWILKNVKVTSGGLTIANKNIPLEHPVYPISTNTLVFVQNSNNITIDNCLICSVDDNSVWKTTDDWNYNAWNGFGSSGGSNISFINNHVKNVNFGSGAGGSKPVSNFIFRNNLIENFCGDGLQFGCSNARIEYNVIRNSYEVNGNHCDLIQGVLSAGPGSGTQIRGNKLIGYTDPNQPFRGDAQGIGLFEGEMKINYIIENNLVVVDTWHGITINNATNCQIINNTVVDPSSSGTGPSWIQISSSEGEQSTGNIIRNNLCNVINTNSNIGTIENNLKISWNDYNTYFVDYEKTDYHLKSGPAIDGGVSTGAPSIDLDSVPRPQGNGIDIGCYEFNGSLANVTGVTLTPGNAELEVGKSLELQVEIEPANAINQNITWASANPQIATVLNGKIVALSQGEAVITVTTEDGNYTDECTVTVIESTGDYNLALFKNVAVSDEDLSGGTPGSNAVNNDISDPSRWSAEGYPQWIEIDLGINCDISSIQIFTYKERAYKYTVEAKPQGGEYTTIVDRSNNTDNTQPITDKVSETARYIKISVTGASDYTGVWISITEIMIFGVPNSDIIPVSGVELDKTSLTLTIDQSVDLTETIAPDNATDRSVKWHSGNPSVATVNDNGLVTAVDIGTTEIIVETATGNFMAKCTVVVENAVTSIINDGNKQIDLKIWPNPASQKDIIQIKFSRLTNNQFIHLRIMDLLGKVKCFEKLQVDSFGLAELNLQQQNLTSGIYILRIESGDKTFQNKLIIK